MHHPAFIVTNVSSSRNSPNSGFLYLFSMYLLLVPHTLCDSFAQAAHLVLIFSEATSSYLSFGSSTNRYNIMHCGDVRNYTITASDILSTTCAISTFPAIGPVTLDSHLSRLSNCCLQSVTMVKLPLHVVKSGPRWEQYQAT